MRVHPLNRKTASEIAKALILVLESEDFNGMSGTFTDPGTEF